MLALEGSQRCGVDYFVDGNRIDDTGDGLSWSTAFAKLSTALAASHANIALAANRNWAGRNRIYVKSDSITDSAKNGVENLVLLADKTDVIGVGSFDANSKACISGNHAPVGAFMSTRFFNMMFIAPAAGGGILMDLVAAQSGIEFHDCEFHAAYAGTAATTGIRATANSRLKIKNCSFYGAFSTAAISIGAGNANQLAIENNFIQSGAVGILVDIGATCAYGKGLIRGNTIYATTLTIDENSNLMVVAGNYLVSANVYGATSFDMDLVLPVGNFFTTADMSGPFPPLDTSA
jgi:hypothetical protein